MVLFFCDGHLGSPTREGWVDRSTSKLNPDPRHLSEALFWQLKAKIVDQ